MLQLPEILSHHRPCPLFSDAAFIALYWTTLQTAQVPTQCDETKFHLEKMQNDILIRSISTCGPIPKERNWSVFSGQQRDKER